MMIVSLVRVNLSNMSQMSRDKKYKIAAIKISMAGKIEL